MAGGRKPMSEPLTRQDLLDMSQVLAVQAYWKGDSERMGRMLRAASVQQYLIDQEARWTREVGHGPPVGQPTFGVFEGGGVRFGSSALRHVETRDPL